MNLMLWMQGAAGVFSLCELRAIRVALDGRTKAAHQLARIGLVIHLAGCALPVALSPIDRLTSLLCFLLAVLGFGLYVRLRIVLNAV